MYKAGFVNILGAPNAGKSTLMNTLMRMHFSAVTPKIQTTRHRIRGIVSGENYQIVFTDTPGIIKPAYKLHQTMMKVVDEAISDGDIFLLMVDITENHEINEIINQLNKVERPVIVLLNKIDLTDQKLLEEKVSEWSSLMKSAEILPISALHKANTETLLNKIISLLPESEPFFPDNELSDKPERFFISELIRESVFIMYKKEIPYCTEIEIESFKEEAKIIRISAIIHVMRESQKIIIIGKKGLAIKKTGTLARKKIESFLNKHVFLELHVKVSPDWRNNDRFLQNFGYDL